jgi:hypothetical protein
MAKERRFTVTIPGNLHMRLKIRCAIDNISMGELVRGALEQECSTVSVSETGAVRRTKTKSPRASAEAA